MKALPFKSFKISWKIMPLSKVNFSRKKINLDKYKWFDVLKEIWENGCIWQTGLDYRLGWKIIYCMPRVFYYNGNSTNSDGFGEKIIIFHNTSHFWYVHCTYRGKNMKIKQILIIFSHKYLTMNKYLCFFPSRYPYIPIIARREMKNIQKPLHCLQNV